MILGFEDLGPLLYIRLYYIGYILWAIGLGNRIYIQGNHTSSILRCQRNALLRQYKALYPSKDPVNSLYNFIKRTF